MKIVLILAGDTRLRKIKCPTCGISVIPKCPFFNICKYKNMGKTLCFRKPKMCDQHNNELEFRKKNHLPIPEMEMNPSKREN